MQKIMIEMVDETRFFFSFQNFGTLENEKE